MAQTTFWYDHLSPEKKTVNHHKAIKLTPKLLELPPSEFMDRLKKLPSSDAIVSSYYFYTIHKLLSGLEPTLVLSSCIDKVLAQMSSQKEISITEFNNVCILLITLSRTTYNNNDPCPNLRNAIWFCNKGDYIKVIELVKGSLFCTCRMEKYSRYIMEQDFKGLFVPVFSKSGIFGYKTFLKLFFSRKIPFGVPTDPNVKINAHNGIIRTRYDLMAHDQEHAMRSIPILTNEPWYLFLRTCYLKILMVNDLRLLCFMFFFIHELGITPDGIYSSFDNPELYSVRTFQKTIRDRFHTGSFSINIECDQHTAKMVSKFVQRKHDIANECDTVFFFLDESFAVFDKKFGVTEKAASLRESQ